jgi:autophagy-related protein 18
MCIGTTNGYYIYACNPFSLLYAKEGESTSILEMLFNTSLVAHVGAGEDADSTQRCLRMINTKREKEVKHPLPIPRATV